MDRGKDKLYKHNSRHLRMMIKIYTRLSRDFFNPFSSIACPELIHDVNPSQLGEAQWCISPI